MNVFITIDTEVWPVHSGGWPLKPLSSQYGCGREVAAYYFGDTKEGCFGVPYQLEMFRRYGLHATYFVDPLFSFALGLDVLQQVVRMIEDGGQRIALHLHPEWLTDPRCSGLPRFRGPLLSMYSTEEQRELVKIGTQRLVEAGGRPLAAFRAGSWGADCATLAVLQEQGIRIDSSLNAHYPHSMPSLPSRMRIQEPSEVHGVVEYPITRFEDGASRAGRPLSVIGTSWAEMRFVLEACREQGRQTVVLVMHSNEFVQTERLREGKAVVPRRTVVKRFERLCEYLEMQRPSISTKFLEDTSPPFFAAEPAHELPRSSRWRTGARMMSQLVSRWH